MKRQVLDICIPTANDEALDIWYYIRENFACTGVGCGYGNFDVQVICNDKKEAIEIVREVEKVFNCKLPYSIYTDGDGDWD